MVDANNLERNLYFTLQLLEMGVPMVVAVNMMDVARDRGMEIDTSRLAAALGCPVVPVVAVTGEGLGRLGAAILEVAAGETAGGRVPGSRARGGGSRRRAGRPDGRRGQEQCTLARASSCWRVTTSRPRRACEAARERARHWQAIIRERSGEEPDIFIADSRFALAHDAA